MGHQPWPLSSPSVSASGALGLPRPMLFVAVLALVVLVDLGLVRRSRVGFVRRFVGSSASGSAGDLVRRGVAVRPVSTIDERRRAVRHRRCRRIHRHRSSARSRRHRRARTSSRAHPWRTSGCAGVSASMSVLLPPEWSDRPDIGRDQNAAEYPREPAGRGDPDRWSRSTDGDAPRRRAARSGRRRTPVRSGAVPLTQRFRSSRRRIRGRDGRGDLAAGLRDRTRSGPGARRRAVGAGADRRRVPGPGRACAIRRSARAVRSGGITG